MCVCYEEPSVQIQYLIRGSVHKCLLSWHPGSSGIAIVIPSAIDRKLVCVLLKLLVVNLPRPNIARSPYRDLLSGVNRSGWSLAQQ